MIRQSQHESPGKRTHPTLLLATWPRLFVRGLSGVMSGPRVQLLPPGQLRVDWFVSEYIMDTTTEWGSCTLLMLTYLMSRNDPNKADLMYAEDEKERAVEV